MNIVHYKSGKPFSVDHSALRDFPKDLSVVTALKGVPYLVTLSEGLFAAGIFTLRDLQEIGISGVRERFRTSETNLDRLRALMLDRYGLELN